MAQLKIRGNTQIIDGTILDAQIASSAAIASSKLADGANFLKKDGSVTWTANHNAGGFKLTNLASGVNPNDAVTYSQLQDVAAGVSVKDACRVATTANITIATDLNVGDVIDGYTLVSGDRVLVKNQTNAVQNGIYTAGASPARATDFDDIPGTEVRSGNLIFVVSGSTQANTSWVLTGSGDLVVDTDPLNFTQFSGAGTQTSSNVGAGAQVFKQLSGNNFEFRTLLDSAEINTDQNANDITFSIVSGSIVGSKLANNTITATQIANDTITAAQIAANAIGASELADDAVDTNAIVANAVTAAKLATDSVTTAKIVDANVTAAKLATDSVITAKIADNAVVQSKLADNSVGTDELINLNVTTAKLADDAVTTVKIASAAVTLAKLAADSVDASKIVDGSVGNAELATDSVTTVKIANLAVTDAKLATDSVTTTKILDGAVTLSKLAADSVNASKIVDGSVGNAELATDAVTNVKVAAAAAIARSKLASGTASHVVINDGSGVMSSEAQLALVRGGTNADLSSASSHAFVHVNAAGTALQATLLTASRAVVTDGNGLPSSSSVTSTELGYLSGVTSSIQTQLDARVSESKIIFGETPTGAIDGSNTSFTLANTPITGKQQVQLNGLVLRSGAGNDYTISGSTITMLYAPVSGDYLAVTYIHD
jgi:hypothetical protein